MRINSKKIIIIVIGTIAIIGGSISLLSGSYNTYVQLLPLSLGLLFLFIYPLYFLNFLKHKIEINDNGLEIQYIIRRLDKLIPFSSMTRFYEIESEWRKKKIKSLIILTINQKQFEIKDDEEKYETIKSAILNHKIKKDACLEERTNVLHLLLLIPIAIFVVAIIGSYINYTNAPKSSSELVEISGTILKKPEKSKSAKSSSFWGLKIYLKEIEGFIFSVDNDDLSERDAEKLLSELRFGDTLKIKISKEDFQAKIAKSITPRFFLKHIEWGNIDVYELKHKGKLYFKFED